MNLLNGSMQSETFGLHVKSEAWCMFMVSNLDANEFGLSPDEGNLHVLKI